MAVVREFKYQTSARRFLERSARCLTSTLKYAYELKFDEKPDYDKIRFLLKKTLLKHDQVPNYKFDWSFDHPDIDNNSGISSMMSSLAPSDNEISKDPINGLLSAKNREYPSDLYLNSRKERNIDYECSSESFNTVQDEDYSSVIVE